MQIHRLTDQLSVSPQIVADDFAAIVRAGFRSVINNRPDGEEGAQPLSDQLALTAAEQGLAYRHLPVVSGNITAGDAADFSRAMQTLPLPVLAFCRTGTRSASLWALQAPGAIDAVLAASQAAGYDLSGLRPQMKTLRGEP